MLDSMTAMQYQEWLAFFKIRTDREKADSGDKPASGYGTSKEGQQRMGADIIKALTGYQKRRDKLKGK